MFGGTSPIRLRGGRPDPRPADERRRKSNIAGKSRRITVSLRNTSVERRYRNHRRLQSCSTNRGRRLGRCLDSPPADSILSAYTTQRSGNPSPGAAVPSRRQGLRELLQSRKGVTQLIHTQLNCKSIGKRGMGRSDPSNSVSAQQWLGREVLSERGPGSLEILQVLRPPTDPQPVGRSVASRRSPEQYPQRTMVAEGRRRALATTRPSSLPGTPVPHRG